MNRTTKPNRT